MPLPSLKILTLATLVVLVVGGVYIARQPEEKTNVDVKTSIGLDTDTDRDGLADWKETLWKTDPDNPDTDQDGTTDGKELAQNRDPRVAGPNDQLSKIEKSETATTTLTQTDILAREIFAGLLALDKEGLLSAETIEEYVADIIERLAPQTPKLFTLKELNIGSEDTALAAHTYGNAVGTILAEEIASVGKEEGNELVIMYQAVESKDPEQLSRLIPRAAARERMTERLRAVSVPPSASLLHLELINRSNTLAIALRNIASFSNDSFAVILWFEVYRQKFDQFETLFNKLSSYLRSRTTFGAGERGSIFMK